MAKQAKAAVDVAEKSYIRIPNRPWYEWLIGVAWLVLIGLMVQNAVASAAELEPRAAMLFWVIAAVMLMAGVVVAVVRRDRQA